MNPLHPEIQYLDLLDNLLAAPARPDRTGTGTRSLFGYQMRFNLADGFPLLTTKRLPFKVIAGELLWMLSGSTNVRPLQEQGITIWNEWADPKTGELGPIYSKQWRSWEGKAVSSYGQGPLDDGPSLVTFTPLIDQIANVLQSLREDPHGRRHIVSAWNPAEIPEMALPPCHALFQFYVEADGRLSLQLYQRSADAFLGLPFNIASYALLLCMFADVLGRERGEFIWTGGDVHLYRNHEDQAREQMTREPRPFPSLRMERAERQDLDTWSLEDFYLCRYHPHPHIAGEVSV